MTYVYIVLGLFFFFVVAFVLFARWHLAWLDQQTPVLIFVKYMPTLFRAEKQTN